MIKINNILVPTDYSKEAHHALLQAFRFAEPLRATVHVLNVVDRKTLNLSDVLEGLFIDKHEVDEQTRLLTTMAAGTGTKADDAVKVVTAERNGASVVDSILKYAEVHGIDLIVMSAYERNNLARVMNRGVTEEIVRRSPCEVITVSGEMSSNQVQVIERSSVSGSFS